MRLMQNFMRVLVVCVVCDMNEVVMSYMCFGFGMGMGAWGHGRREGCLFPWGYGKGCFFSFLGRNMMTCSLYMS